MEKIKSVTEMQSDEVAKEWFDKKAAIRKHHAEAKARAVRTPEENKHLMNVLQELYGLK